MEAQETLNLISKQWCTLEDLMALGEFGRNSALKVKREIKNKLINQGYKIPSHVIPTKEVVNDLKMLLESDKKVYGFNTKWFLFGKDDPITNSKVRCRKNMLCKKAGLKQIRIHDFRHSFASLLINTGQPVTTVSKYLGHASTKETLDTYAHMFPNNLSDVKNTIDNLNLGI